MQTLTPGMNVPLPPGQRVQIRVTGARAHVDPVVLLLDAHRRADGDNGVVLFSNPIACGGAVRLEVQSDVVKRRSGRPPRTRRDRACGRTG
jgi:stress response protein SCP2